MPLFAAGAAIVVGAMSDDGGGGASAGQEAASQAQADIARKEWKFYEEEYQPLERELIEETRETGTAEDQERFAGEAQADVTQSYDRARRESEGRMRAAGFTEADPRFSSAQQTFGASEAMTRAGATTAARRGRKDLRFDRLYGMAGLGRGLVTGAQSGFSQAGAGFGRAAAEQEGRARRRAGDIAYATEPLVQAGQKWWDNRNTPAPKSGVNTGGMGGGGGSSYLGGGAYDWSNYADGGLTHRRWPMADGGVAENGEIQGPGTETSDDVPINASDGEYIINADAVKRVGTDVLDAINLKGLERRIH